MSDSRLPRFAERFGADPVRRHVSLPTRSPTPSSRFRLHRVANSSLGVRRTTPPPTTLPEFTPERAVARPSVVRVQAVHSFRPCRSTRLRRLTPLAAAQVCCTLQPVMGSAVFQSRVLSTKVLNATVAGFPLRRLPFEAFPLQTAVTRHRVRCPRAVVPVSDSLTSATLLRRRSRARFFFRSLDLKALLHLQSRCERSTVASRVLPVAPLGFSFWCVSCPTRRSSELRAHHCQTSLTVGDFSFTLGGPRASSHRRRWC